MYTSSRSRFTRRCPRATSYPESEKLEHLYEGFALGKADAALAASVFHFGQFRINDAKRYLAAKGITVRNVEV